MVRQFLSAYLDVVPHELLVTVDDSDVDHRFFRLENASQEPGYGFWFERDVEYALGPALGGPSGRFTEIVDHAPVGQTYHAVEVHFVEIRAHAGCVGLALVENHSWKSAAVAGEIHISVIIRGDVGGQGQRGGEGVGVDVAVAGVHGHGQGSGGVVAL